jgi:hypothetical protein
MGEIYELSCLNNFRLHETHTKICDDQFRHSSNNEVIITIISQAVMLVLLMGGTYELSIEIPSCVIVYVPHFMKSGTDIPRILGVCLSSLRACNVGITDRRHL